MTKMIILVALFVIAFAPQQIFSNPEAGQAFFITSSVAASIKIDCKSVGDIEAKKSREFPVEYHGEHWIEAYSPSGMLLSREKASVAAGAQKLYEVPVGHGLPGTATINGASYRTVYLFGKEWLAESLRDENAGYTAGPPYGEKLYIWDHLKNFVPAGPGWRVPTVADFRSLVSNLPSPVIDLQPGGISGLNILKSGFHSGRDPADHNGRGQFGMIWTSDNAAAANHKQAFRLSTDISYTPWAMASHNFISVRYVRDHTPKGPCD